MFPAVITFRSEEGRTLCTLCTLCTHTHTHSNSYAYMYKYNCRKAEMDQELMDYGVHIVKYSLDILMAMPWSVRVFLAGLSGAFYKTVPRFPVEVCTTIGVCLPAMRLQKTPGRVCLSCEILKGLRVPHCRLFQALHHQGIVEVPQLLLGAGGGACGLQSLLQPPPPLHVNGPDRAFQGGGGLHATTG